MANRIKGITIELEGNPTKLVDSLKTVDSQLKKTETKLRDVNKLLKLKPGNTELLKQKQKALADSIETTKEKLSELKSVQKESVSPEEWDAIQREIIETEAKLDGLKKQMNDFGSVGAQQVKLVGEKMQSFGNGMKDVGEKLTKYVTGPILAIGGASLAAFNEVDEGLDIIQKKTGATGDEMSGMSDILKNITTSIPTDFATAGTAIGEVSTRFGVTGDELENLSSQFIKFADLTGSDVTSSIDQTQKALSAFGLGADDAGGFLDRMNKVSQDTGVSVDKLQSGLVQNATAFKELGMDIDQSTSFMGKLEKSGANSETVMNGLRKALKSATSEGVPLKDALANLQNEIENGTGSMDGLNAAYEVFGKSGDQIYGAVKDGTINFNDLAVALDDAGGSVSDTFEAIQDPTDDFKTVMNNVKIAGMELATTAMPLISTALEKLTGIVSTLREKWEGLSPQQQDMIVKVGLIVAAVGPLLMGLGSLIASVGTLLTFAPAVMTFLAGPVAPIIGIGVAVAGLAVIIYKNWDKIQAWTTSMVSKIKDQWAQFKAKTSEAFNAAKSTVISVVTGIKTRISSLLGSVRSTFQSIKTAITSPIETAKSTVLSAVERIKGIFPIQLGKIFSGIKLPHFRISGGEIPWGIGGKGVKPSVSIDWYKKGAIFTRPTFFQYGSKLGGLGEAGAEAVLPLDDLWAGMREMGDNIVNGITQAPVAETGPTVINLYAYPSGPKMEQWVVQTYDRGKRRLG